MKNLEKMKGNAQKFELNFLADIQNVSKASCLRDEGRIPHAYYGILGNRNDSHEQ